MDKDYEPYTEDTISFKMEVISVRIHPEIRMRIGEVAKRFGVTISSVVNMCLRKVFAELYDEEGNMLTTASPDVRRTIRIEDGCYPLTVFARAFGVNKKSMEKRLWRRCVRPVKRRNELYFLYKDVVRIYGEEEKDHKEG